MRWTMISICQRQPRAFAGTITPRLCEARRQRLFYSNPFAPKQSHLTRIAHAIFPRLCEAPNNNYLVTTHLRRSNLTGARPGTTPNKNTSPGNPPSFGGEGRGEGGTINSPSIYYYQLRSPSLVKHSAHYTNPG